MSSVDYPWAAGYEPPAPRRPAAPPPAPASAPAAPAFNPRAYDWAAEGGGSRAASRPAPPPPPGDDTPPPPPTPRDRPTPPGDPNAAAVNASLRQQLLEMQRELREMQNRPSPQEIARQDRERNKAALMATMSWLPSELLTSYVDEWVRTGDGELAWGLVRTSKPYDQYFPQIRRQDGSLRMTEQEYLSHKDAFERELRQWGMNPELFMPKHQALIAGEVSATEFRQRIDAKATGVMQNLPEVRQRFGEFYGIDGMSDEALIAAAIDPDIGRGLLQGRISAAQISGEALRAGFDRGIEASERLAQTVGLDQSRAREFYSRAGQAVPRFGRFAERFQAGQFGIEQYEQAGLFGDSELQRTMRRLHASEMAMFSRGGSITMNQSGSMTGLARR